MTKDAGEWEPQPGERVGIVIPHQDGLHESVPRNGFGFFRQYLGDHERYPYEVLTEGNDNPEWRLFCYAREELEPVNDGRR